ncbi:MAG: N-acetylglucosaminyltransferase [Gemmatales bacterium]|nr:MAG: N-acetylglucosaminyltransferase [Gemmatales bacterium]
MLIDWTHWLSVRHPDELLAFLWALILIDSTRYALSKTVMCLTDMAGDFYRWIRGERRQVEFTHCPTVCLIVAGYNEAENIRFTLESVWGSYPKLEIIVVDDGSQDGFFSQALQFAQSHPGVLVLRMPERSGKSPALNLALRYSRAEIIVAMDADSQLSENAIWEIVQPFADENIGVVAGSLSVRNAFTNLVTWLQAYEYLHSIFVGRLLSARLGILGIASGAFSAFRRTALEQTVGWDVGPGEDLDLTLRIRKAGYEIAYAPYAECQTNVPTTWRALIKQRFRWERSGIVRHHFRKHLDFADWSSANFRFGDFTVWFDVFFFNFLCMIGIVVFFVRFFLIDKPVDWWELLLTLYLCYLLFELIQVLAACIYSNYLRRDAAICAIFVFAPIYQIFLLWIRFIATIQEALFRKSFEDNFAPARVRESTWHW